MPSGAVRSGVGEGDGGRYAGISGPAGVFRGGAPDRPVPIEAGNLERGKCRNGTEVRNGGAARPRKTTHRFRREALRTLVAFENNHLPLGLAALSDARL